MKRWQLAQLSLLRQLRGLLVGEALVVGQVLGERVNQRQLAGLGDVGGFAGEGPPELRQRGGGQGLLLQQLHGPQQQHPILNGVEVGLLNAPRPAFQLPEALEGIAAQPEQQPQHGQNTEADFGF